MHNPNLPNIQMVLLPTVWGAKYENLGLSNCQQKLGGDVCDVCVWYQKPVRVRDCFERITVKGWFSSMLRLVYILWLSVLFGDVSVDKRSIQ